MNPLRCMTLIALCVATALSSLAAEQSKPNVVVFLADDAGWGDYGATGNELARTPHIDTLARDGVTLDRFFVCPVCSPTRAEFLTGRYHPRMDVYGTSLGQERMNLGESTIAEAFQAAGYSTGAFGKWHNGSQWPYHPCARGFDEYYGHTAGHWGEYFDPPLEHNGQPVRGEGYIVDLCTDQALAFVEKNRDKPFFCYVPFTTPHSPWAAPEENWARFKNQPVPQRATLPGKENLDHTRCAMAMLENQDSNVGRVLRKLDELDLAENTIVVYFSDNGPNSWRWNGGMKGRKGSTDEGGVRSACFLRWPAKLPQGHTVADITGAIDLLPTLASLAGISRGGDKPLDGRDISPLLIGTAREWPERMIFSTWAGRTSVRTPQYRLDHTGDLYDMIADPDQTKPVNAKRPDVASELAEAVVNWRNEVSGGETAAGNRRAVDPRPLPVGYPEFPRTWLPARDAEPLGGVKRSASAPNCSYFVNWTSPEDAIVWEIEVNQPGEYKVELRYTCALPDVGSTIELAFQDSRLTGKVQPGWDPPLYTNQDTLPRPPAESQMKEFRLLDLGTIRLEQGRGALTLRALDIPGDEVMHLRSVSLTLVQ